MEIRNNRLHLGGVPAEELTGRFGSPLYVYEEETLRRRAGELRDSILFPDKKIKYACKANTNIEIIRILREEGMGIDAISPGEVHASLTAGVPPGDILFTSNNATLEEIDYAVEKGALVNVDSLSHLEAFGRRYPGKPICVRINPNVGGGHHNHVITGGPDSKFGISYREVDRILGTAGDHGLAVTGIHQHIGSGILDPSLFVEAMDVLLDVARRFGDLAFVDFGGGIGVPYREDQRRIDVAVLGRKITEDFEGFCARYGRRLTLVLEPGRYPVAECGYLLATVTAVKEGGAHRFVGVDTGFNHLVRPAMYGSYHRILHAGRVEGPLTPQVVAGNICESGDVFTRDENGIVDRELPLFREGDTLCICNAGAYGYSMSSNYNSRPRPAEVLVKDGRARIIRRRERIEDLFRDG
jgi:diaminopimelate decarboxylase